MRLKIHTQIGVLVAAFAAVSLASAQSSKGAPAENPYTREAISAAVEAQMSVRNTIKGEDLLNRLSKAMLLTYVTGVDDLGTMTADGARRYCRPEGSTNGQMADIVSKYLTLNPENRHLGGAYLVRQALHEAWPCPMTTAPSSGPAKRQPPDM